MEKHIQELFANLQQQLDCYKRLLEFARAKRPVLVEGNIKELDNIVKKEELLIFEVGRLEEKRVAIHRALADHFMLSVEDLTAVELEKRIDKDLGTKINQLLKDFDEVLKELSELNETNSELIQTSLDYINFSLNLLTSERAPGYHEHDQAEGRPGAKVFDRKI